MSRFWMPFGRLGWLLAWLLVGSCNGGVITLDTGAPESSGITADSEGSPSPDPGAGAGDGRGSGQAPGGQGAGQGSSPTAVCGNRVVEPPDEVCDGESRDCVGLDPAFTGGKAACKADCKGYDLAQCTRAATIDEAVAQVDRARVQAMVEALAADDMAGRGAGTAGGQKAVGYIKEKFQAAGLSPGKGPDYLQPFGQGMNNVIGVLPGTDPALKDQVIVVGGHHDHLGTKFNQIYHGADDNASGTVAVIELAYAAAKLRGQLKRTVVFMTFDGEELGLLGSVHYCKKEPIFPIAKTVLMMNFDMIGRRAYDLAQYGSGTDSQSFEAVRVKTKDYHTGLHADYHKPTDTADKINYDGMVNTIKSALGLLWQTAQAAKLSATQEIQFGAATLPERPFLDHGVAPFPTAP